MKKTDSLLFLFLVLVTFLFRLPFASKWLYHVDSVIYALAMEKFDIIQNIPSAPGYIGYIYLGKIFCYFTGDPNRSLVLIGILFSGLSCGMGYLLSKEMFGGINGLITAFLLLTSPLIWFFGEIALSAIANLFFSILVAFFCYKTITTSRLSPIIFSSLSLGIGSAFRQDLLIFMSPLWLFALSKRSAKQIFLGILILFVISLIWLIPLSLYSGGLIPYLTLCKERIFGPSGHLSYLTHTNVFLKGIHLYNYFFTLVLAFFLGIVPFIFYLGRFFNPFTVFRDRKIQFLMLWILPCFIYINLVGGSPGYSLVHLGALFICLSMALESISDDFKKTGYAYFGKSILVILIILIFGVNIFFFLCDPHPQKIWMGNTWFRKTDIQKHDNLLGSKIDYIKRHFSPEDSIIIAGGPKQSFWPALYYLPYYRVYQPNMVYWKGDTFMEMAFHHKRSPIIGPVFKITEDIKNIIFFDEDIYPYIKNPKPLKKVSLDKGYYLYVLSITTEVRLKLTPFSLEAF